VTRGTAARATLLALLAAAWAVAAWLLWESSVVPSFKLPQLDEHRYFLVVNASNREPVVPLAEGA